MSTLELELEHTRRTRTVSNELFDWQFSVRDSMSSMWRDEILEGVSQLNFKKSGTIVIHGEKAQPILATDSGKIICVAAEYGKGRVVYFAQKREMCAIKDDLHDPNIARLLHNVTRWVTHGRENPIKQNWRSVEGDPSEIHILYGHGTGNATEQEIALLREFVYGGGGLMIGELPWRFLSNNPASDISTMNRLPLLFGFSFLNVREIESGSLLFTSSDLVDYSDGYRAGNLCYILNNFPIFVEQNRVRANMVTSVFKQISEPVVRHIESELLEIIEQNMDNMHFKPTPDTPVKKPEDMVLVSMMDCCFRALGRCVRGMNVIPTCRIFPGNQVSWPQPQTFDFEAPANQFGVAVSTATGYYLPPGGTLTLEVLGSMPGVHTRWRVVVGSHYDNLMTESASAWIRWPKLGVQDKITTRQLSINTHVGGLVYLVSKGKVSQPLQVRLHNVVKAPIYDSTSQQSIREWSERKRSPGLWAELIGRYIRFTVPSSSVQNLNPADLLQYWDNVVKHHYDLRGWSVDDRPRQWVVADEQPKVGYMHAGYPIVARLKVAQACQWEGVNDCPCILNIEHLEERGCWALYHELGHNCQSNAWTFQGTKEVTCNIFTLYTMDLQCARKPWLHQFLLNKGRPEKVDDYIKAGAMFREWKTSAGIALYIYAQLARDFGWRPYKELFALYDKLPEDALPRSDEDSMHQWIVRFSKQVGRNLVPLFMFWGFPIQDRTCDQVATLPFHMPEDEVTQAHPNRVELVLESCKEAVLRFWFRSFDVNGDGQIDAKELQTVFAEMGKTFSERDMKRMISKVDDDRSGTLDYEEFVVMVFGKR